MKTRRLVFTFRSQSRPEKTYDTIVWSDGQITCVCPGWTRRVQPDGVRLCVHTRLVQLGDPSKDPLFVSCDPPLNGLLDIPYPAQDYGSRASTDRESLSWGWFGDVPSRFQDAMRGNLCKTCSRYHFPEYFQCDGRKQPDYIPVDGMRAANFAPLSVRKRAVFFEEVRIPTSWVPYFKRVGRCDDCSNFHFPEYENCAARWTRPLLRMPAPQVVKIKPVAKAEPEPITKPQRRKFNFDE